MPTRPEDIVNRALDECGVEEIGDLFEGSPAARAALRIYDSVLRGLSATAHWNFLRRQQQMVMLADRSGFYVPNTLVPEPWNYMYEWPVDCIHARWVVRMGTTALTESLEPVGVPPAWVSPAPFVVGAAPLPNDDTSDWSEIEGHNPESTRVILCNELAATLVYTGLNQYPDSWDPLFEQAMVATMASRLVIPTLGKKDMKAALAIRQQNLVIAKQAVDEARIRDGNEGWTVIDHTPDWIRARTDTSDTWGWLPMIEDGGGSY